MKVIFLKNLNLLISAKSYTMQSTRLSKNKLESFLQTVGLAVVQLYKLILSPHVGGACRFTPSCSEYGAEAFVRYSFFKALGMTILRILKCNPFGPYGHDPVLKTKWPEKVSDAFSTGPQLCKTKGDLNESI